MLLLHHCDKYLGKNNLRDGIFVLAHGFRGFSPYSLTLVDTGPMVWQKIMAAGVCGGSLLTSWSTGSRKQGGNASYILQDLPAMNYFLQLGPSSYKQCHQLGTKYLTNKPVGDISYSNHIQPSVL
jgi:hypothetical protein